MEIKKEKQGDVTIIAIDDHLDTATAPEFESRLLGIIAAGDKYILIDCAGLDYVNSAGLKVFLLAAKRLEPLEGILVLCSLSPSVLMVFEMIGFTSIMKVAPNREEALHAFPGAAAS